MIQWISKLHWGIKIVTAAFAFFVAMGSAAATWDTFGWWKPASVQYVNDQLKDIHTSQRAIQLDLANGKREGTETDIAKWQLELKKTSDESSVGLINRTLKTLNTTKEKLDKQIEFLERGK